MAAIVLSLDLAEDYSRAGTPPTADPVSHLQLSGAASQQRRQLGRGEHTDYGC